MEQKNYEEIRGIQSALHSNMFVDSGKELTESDVELGTSSMRLYIQFQQLINESERIAVEEERNKLERERFEKEFEQKERFEEKKIEIEEKKIEVLKDQARIEDKRVELENRPKSKGEKTIEVLKVVVPLACAGITAVTTFAALGQNTANLGSILSVEQTGLINTKAFSKCWAPFKIKI